MFVVVLKISVGELNPTSLKMEVIFEKVADKESKGVCNF